MYYEVVAPKGDISPNAFVTDGVFRASKCGTYLVNVYVFQTNSEKNKWLSDRKKYKDKGSGIYDRQREIKKRLKMAGEMIAEFTESLERARDRQEEKTEQKISRDSRSQK